MPHIKTLTIRNFQSHKDTELHMHPGVNVIVGESDSGKSAVMRSIGWVKDNRPLGEAFRSTWCGKTLVELEFSDSCVVGRETDKEKLYYVNDADFKAFKTEVPVEVETALNMNEVNIQRQMDAPFLLSASSGDVAKFLNKTANLSQIDGAVSSIRKLVLHNRQEAQNLEQQVKDLQEQKGGFSELPIFESAVLLWEKVSEDTTEVNSSISAIEYFAHKITEQQENIKALDSFLKLETPLGAALTLQEELKAVEGSISALFRVVQSTQQGIAELNAFGNLDEMCAGVENALYEHSQKIKAFEEVAGEVADLMLFINNSERLIKRITDADVFIISSTSQYSKEIPSECPLCGRHE